MKPANPFLAEKGIKELMRVAHQADAIASPDDDTGGYANVLRLRTKRHMQA